MSNKTQAYTAPHPVYVDQRYYKPGEPFATTAEPGEGWEKAKPAEVAAIEASTNLIPDDATLEAASVSALQAVAIIKSVNIIGLKTKAELITAIKAANEPAL